MAPNATISSHAKRLAAVSARGLHDVGVVEQLLTFEPIKAAAGADHHSRQARLGVELVPQLRLAISGQRPQPGQPVRTFVGRCAPARDASCDPYDGRRTRLAINAFVANVTCCWRP
jgi:hypothetical protein